METMPPICIVSVYMPCRGNSTKLQFEATIAELQDFTSKYGNSHALFICGDFNSSLSRHPANERDMLLISFCAKNNLVNGQDGAYTLFHTNNDSTADIDYILTNTNAVNLTSGVHVLNINHGNVSDHVPIAASLNINIDRQKEKEPVTPIPCKPR